MLIHLFDSLCTWRFLSFDFKLPKNEEFTMPFETDLVVYEKTDVIKPGL